MSAVFVSASGTDVGKTYVTCELLRHLRARGVAVDARKPVLSGASDDDAGGDTALLLGALGVERTPAALDRLSPWRFRAPLSPDLAAAREGRTVDFEALIAHSLAAVGESRDGDGIERFLAIEGVGGVLVPLDRTHTVADWIERLGLPVLLVGGTYLGALSHTLTALEVLRARGLRVACAVANESPDAAISVEETAATLRRFAGSVPVIGVGRGSTGSHAAFAAIAAALRAAHS